MLKEIVKDNNRIIRNKALSTHDLQLNATSTQDALQQYHIGPQKIILIRLGPNAVWQQAGLSTANT